AGGLNETAPQEVTVSKDDVTISYVSGNNSDVTRADADTTSLVLSIYDTDRSAYVSSGVNCSIWITTDGANYGSANTNMTTSDGNCTIDFNPSSSEYNTGMQDWTGGTESAEHYKDANYTGDLMLTIIGDIESSLEQPSGGIYNAGDSAVTFRWNVTDDNSTLTSGVSATVEMKLNTSSAWETVCDGSNINNETGTETGWYNCSWTVPGAQPAGSYDTKINLSKTYFNSDTGTYNDKFSVYNGPPQITDIAVVPQTAGYGYNITISANVTDYDGGVFYVMANITYPDGSDILLDMTNYSQDIYEVNFTDTWPRDRYNYTIFTNDTLGYLNTSGINHMYVSSNATINITAENDTYNGYEYVYLKNNPIGLSIANNTGNLDMKAVLLMKIQNNNSAEWIDAETIINQAINISSQNYLDIAKIWNDTGGWHIGSYQTGYYRIYASLNDIYGNVLQNDTGGYMNGTYLFYLQTLTPYSSDVDASPEDPEVGDDVNFSAFWYANNGILDTWTFSWNITGAIADDNPLQFNPSPYPNQSGTQIINGTGQGSTNDLNTDDSTTYNISSAEVISISAAEQITNGNFYSNPGSWVTSGDATIEWIDTGQTGGSEKVSNNVKNTVRHGYINQSFSYTGDTPPYSSQMSYCYKVNQYAKVDNIVLDVYLRPPGGTDNLLDTVTLIAETGWVCPTVQIDTGNFT
ncbi:hypothetical protein KAU11_06735, partial [Candidatus Babeliales bacterium]|nr:hypothetical protein [Candidatus Babeliales bacterium]